MPLARISGGTLGATSSGAGEFGFTSTRPPPPSSDHSSRAPRSRSTLCCGNDDLELLLGDPAVTLVGVGERLEIEVVDERAALDATHLEPQRERSGVGLLSDRLGHHLVRLGGESHERCRRRRGLEVIGLGSHGGQSTGRREGADPGTTRPSASRVALFPSLKCRGALRSANESSFGGGRGEAVRAISWWRCLAYRRRRGGRRYRAHSHCVLARGCGDHDHRHRRRRRGGTPATALRHTNDGTGLHVARPHGKPPPSVVLSW